MILHVWHRALRLAVILWCQYRWLCIQLGRRPAIQTSHTWVVSAWTRWRHAMRNVPYYVYLLFLMRTCVYFWNYSARRQMKWVMCTTLASENNQLRSHRRHTCAVTSPVWSGEWRGIAVNCCCSFPRRLSDRLSPSLSFSALCTAWPNYSPNGPQANAYLKPEVQRQPICGAFGMIGRLHSHVNW